jgi:alpha-L-rhamnosidase
MRVRGLMVLLLLVGAAAVGAWWWLLRTPAESLVEAETPTGLTVDHRIDPIGIDSAAPHLSWRHEVETRNWKQRAYQVLVATDPTLLRDGVADVWDSGRQDSDQSHGIVYAGPTLVSGRRYYWSVRTWNGNGQMSALARPAFWEMGLLAQGDWQASWIAGNLPDTEVDREGIRWIYVAGADAMQMPLDTASHFRVSIDLPEVP